jgi:hypothetical protein
MEDLKAPTVFETSNLDLGAFLMLEGIKYIGCRITLDPARDEPKAVLKFLDEKLNSRDLERVFISSREKKYRELHKYLLRDIHGEIKKFHGKLREQVEE